MLSVDLSSFSRQWELNPIYYVDWKYLTGKSLSLWPYYRKSSEECGHSAGTTGWNRPGVFLSIEESDVKRTITLSVSTVAIGNWDWSCPDFKI